MDGLLSEEIRRLTLCCKARCPALDSTALLISRFDYREPASCKVNSAEACPTTHCTELLNCECSGFLGQGSRVSSWDSQDDPRRAREGALFPISGQGGARTYRRKRILGISQYWVKECGEGLDNGA